MKGYCVGVEQNSCARTRILLRLGLNPGLPFGGGADKTPVCSDEECETCLAFTWNRTQERDYESNKLLQVKQGCAHPALKYAQFQQPFMASKAAVEAMLPVLVHGGLQEQCRVTGLTHDNALGLLMFALGVPPAPHFSACQHVHTGDLPETPADTEKLNPQQPPPLAAKSQHWLSGWGKTNNGDFLHTYANSPSSMQSVFEMYQQRHLKNSNGTAWDHDAASRAVRRCVLRNHDMEHPGGVWAKGGVTATRYWTRTTAAQRGESGDGSLFEPFRFEDCANFPHDGNNASGLIRPPTILLNSSSGLLVSNTHHPTAHHKPKHQRASQAILL
mmetsp:Transcript_84128/g.163480  ORF Transcript_84128/g.163480 Transcript_84128/m.163480 type:complete len:330 (-) Transcript_84128:165-1154(-)